MLSMADIAVMMQVSTRTVRLWRSEGILPPADLEIGKTIRWSRETVASWLASSPTRAV